MQKSCNSCLAWVNCKVGIWNSKGFALNSFLRYLEDSQNWQNPKFTSKLDKLIKSLKQSKWQIKNAAERIIYELLYNYFFSYLKNYLKTLCKSLLQNIFLELRLFLVQFCYTASERSNHYWSKNLWHTQCKM